MFCEACERMWKEIPSKLDIAQERKGQYFIKATHHHSLPSLSQSAEAKCSLCIRLFHLLDSPHFEYLTPMEHRPERIAYQLQIPLHRSNETQEGSAASLSFWVEEPYGGRLFANFDMISSKGGCRCLHPRLTELICLNKR